MKRCALCEVEFVPIGTGQGQKKYCGEECARISRAEYDRQRKRRKYASDPSVQKRYEKTAKAQKTRKDYYPRYKVLRMAREEAKRAGCSKLSILAQWGEPIGRARELQR